MCENCYEEAGSPHIVNEKTMKAANLIAKIYQQDGCGAGGYAHIVVDDWNLEDDNIEYCIKEATVGDYEDISEGGRVACLNCLNSLKELTEAERYSAMAINDGFLPTEPTDRQIERMNEQ